jgi:hypothetical protein
MPKNEIDIAGNQMENEIILPKLAVDENKVFPHFLLCIPIALILTWVFIHLVTSYWFYLKINLNGITDGAVLMIAVARVMIEIDFFHAPIMLTAQVGIAYWNCKFAREGGATKWNMLWRGTGSMLALFLFGLVIEWVLAKRYPAGESHTLMEFLKEYLTHWG